MYIAKSSYVYIQVYNIMCIMCLIFVKLYEISNKSIAWSSVRFSSLAIPTRVCVVPPNKS